ncbi:MAG: hypothetical protein ACRD3D_13080 [Terriglobia bacterium]
MSTPGSKQNPRCRYCGCTQSNACLTLFNEPCHWIETPRKHKVDGAIAYTGVCSNPECVRRLQLDKKNAKEAPGYVPAPATTPVEGNTVICQHRRSCGCIEAAVEIALSRFDGAAFVQTAAGTLKVSRKDEERECGSS